MKDRIVPCVNYVCAHSDCKKGRKDVTMDKCQTCNKYRPRKLAIKRLTIKSRKEKSIKRDLDRYKREF